MRRALILLPCLFLRCSDAGVLELCSLDGSGACICPGGFEGTICGDRVDDDCDGADETCPSTSQADLQIPSWDCSSDSPPANVYAWARFEDGGGYFQAGACFVFFEGLPGEFYVRRQGLTRVSTEPSCETQSGCVCPSLDGWPSYDRRLYAFTLNGEAEACDPIVMVDHGGEDQPVSNACRKYLYQLHYYDIEYSYIASSEAEIDARLEYFPTVEIACAEDSPHDALPFASLLRTPIQRNPDFQSAR